MQLKKHTSIKASLSTATGALLGGLAPQAQAGIVDGWEMDAALLYYSESDGRVKAAEPTVRGRKEIDDDEFLDLKLVVDTLTGATPTGAVPASEAQTFTRPSGNGSYTVEAGEVPLDDTFQDTRWQISANWDTPFGRLTRGQFGVNVSNEYDFQSVGGSATLIRDFNQRNTTFSAGVSFESDTIEPEGGVPTPFAGLLMATGDDFDDDIDDDFGDDDYDDDDRDTRVTSETRDQLDLLLGLTQVIGPRTLMQFNIAYAQSDGYHNDPFKLISIVDDAPGPNQGEPIDNLYENRPDSRAKTAFYWQTKHALDRDVIDVSYRYMTDDWGIESHTLDFRYDWTLDSGSFIQPHIRYYQQNAADFYNTLLPASQTLPQYASADYRLGDMTGVTYGVKYSYPMQSGNRLELRLEMMTQTNDPSPGSRIGSQADRELILDTQALIFQINYSF